MKTKMKLLLAASMLTLSLGATPQSAWAWFPPVTFPPVPPPDPKPEPKPVPKPKMIDHSSPVVSEVVSPALSTLPG